VSSSSSSPPSSSSNLSEKPQGLAFLPNHSNLRHQTRRKTTSPWFIIAPIPIIPAIRKKKLGFPKKTQIQKQQHTHKKATTGPQKKGQIPNIEGGGGMDSKSDGDGKCRGGASELKPANRA
jgi:hypothetical protein